MLAHDFFKPQVVKNVDVFLLRMIMHDYPDSLCIKILSHLRAAAKPSTQLVVVDSLMAYTCEETTSHEIPGAERILPPEPLLKNWGDVNLVPYLGDMQMMAVTGGKERTLTQFRDLLGKAGWKVERAHYGMPFVFSNQKVIATPA